jgi:thiamine monophosphate synthase
MENTRRRFLRLSAGLAAVSASTAASASPSLPTVQIGKHQISRMILGSNPFYGYSHSSANLDQHMREWATPEHVVEALREAEKNGVTTFQTNAQDRALSDVELYRRGGGKLQFMVLARETPESIAARIHPLAIVHHGESTDAAFQTDNMDDVREFTKKVRQTGVLVGVSTHKPEVIEYIEEHNWDVDFFMGCVYNRTRTLEELRNLLNGELPLPANEVYLEKDPQRMFAVMRKTRKHCLAFKILAAGRSARTPKDLNAAFRAAFAGIKPDDCVIVGNYQRFKNEIQENAERVRAILRPAT